MAVLPRRGSRVRGARSSWSPFTALRGSAAGAVAPGERPAGRARPIARRHGARRGASPRSLRRHPHGRVRRDVLPAPHPAGHGLGVLRGPVRGRAHTVAPGARDDARPVHPAAGPRGGERSNRCGPTGASTCSPGSADPEGADAGGPEPGTGSPPLRPPGADPCLPASPPDGGGPGGLADSVPPSGDPAAVAAQRGSSGLERIVPPVHQ